MVALTTTVARPSQPWLAGPELAGTELPTAGSDVLLRLPCGATQRAHGVILRLASPLMAEKLNKADGAARLNRAGGAAELNGAGVAAEHNGVDCAAEHNGAGAAAGECGAVVLDLDTDAALFQRLLHFLYPIYPRPQLVAHEAARLYPQCHKYMFVGLMEACRQVLEGGEVVGLLGKNSPADSPHTWVLACQWLELARDYSLHGLQAKCLKYIRRSGTATTSLPTSKTLQHVIVSLQQVTAASAARPVGLMQARAANRPEAAASAVASLAESVQRLVAERECALVPCAPRLALGEAELRQLRRLSKDTLVAIIQAVVAEERGGGEEGGGEEEDGEQADGCAQLGRGPRSGNEDGEE